MATKEFITLDGLSRYHELISQVISDGDADSIKSISVSGNTVNFYKNSTATGTPAYSVNMPDVSGFMDKISGATGGKIVTSTSAGQVSESATAISDLMSKGSNWAGNKAAITNSNGTVGESNYKIGAYETTGLVTGYFNDANKLLITNGEMADIIESDIEISDLKDSIAATAGFDGDNTIADAITDATRALIPYDQQSTGYIAGFDSNGISVGNTMIETSAVRASLDATSGFDGSNTIADAISALSDDVADKIDKISSPTGGKIATTTAQGGVAESSTAISDLATNAFVGSIPQGATATTVVGYVDEAVGEVEDIADDKTVYIVDNGATSAYAKVYSIYQGSTGSAASPVAGEKLIDINIPKDQVVESGSVADITFHDSKLWDGVTDVTALIKGTGTPTAADAGKYIKLVLQNVTDPLYIAAQSLVDIYTAQPNATSVQLTISNTNEISAVIVDGAVTTAKIADGNVTKAKLAQGVQDSLDLADSAVQSVAEGATNGTVAVDGTDVAVHGLGSAAYTASTAYDAAGSAATAKSDVIGSSSDGASANTVWGAKAYADASTSAVPISSIESLFE